MRGFLNNRIATTSSPMIGIRITGAAHLKWFKKSTGIDGIRRFLLKEPIRQDGIFNMLIAKFNVTAILKWMKRRKNENCTIQICPRCTCFNSG